MKTPALLTAPPARDNSMRWRNSHPMGLIPGVSSIAVPSNVPVPFRDYLGTFRVDWAQSERSRWFLRAAGDTYTTHNALVQQGALPSTGVTSHNNYFNAVVGQQFTFSPEWFGSLVLDSSGLHLTQTRKSDGLCAGVSVYDYVQRHHRI